MKQAPSSANFLTFLNKKLVRENCSPLRAKPALGLANPLSDYLKPSVSVTDVAKASQQNSKVNLNPPIVSQEHQVARHNFKLEEPQL